MNTIKKGIKLAVIGSRTFKDKKKGFFELDEFAKTNEIVAIVSGVGFDDKYDNGADTIGRDYAKEREIKYIGFPADWSDMSEPCVVKYNRYNKPYNALAGFKRNTNIIDECTDVIAFWDGKSPGTKDSIDKAKALNKSIKIVKI